MSRWIDHLAIVPVILPLAVGAVLLLVDERRAKLKAAIGIASTLALLGVALALLRVADATAPGASAPMAVYLLGNWPAPYGIVLVADRLAALMLVLTSILALAALCFSLAGWDRAGARFHSLLQFLLMGLNGAFLTGDLFNLFVFFEVLLAASYGLVLHGSGPARVKAGLHYIAINLTVSSLFLIGVSLIYGAAGTLNMADLARRIPAIAADRRVLLETGAAILGVAFLVKAAIWPLGFWLPSTYAAAAPPVAALFSIMSKVGIYAVLRLWLLLFGGAAGASAHFGGFWLVAGGIVTILFGSVGILASRDLARLAGFNLLVSSGTLLAIIGAGNAAAIGAALFYLVSSTLAVGAFFLLTELMERGRAPAAATLADPIGVFGRAGGSDEGEPYGDDAEAGVAIPATMAILGLSFACCALVLAGLPPLPGFIAKFLMLTALLQPAAGATGAVAPTIWILTALLLASGLAAAVAMTRAGIGRFWREHAVPRIRIIEMTPILVLLLLCLALTAQAGPVMRFMQATAASLHAPQAYIRDVLSAPRTPPAPQAGEP
jgi:multicomponent K+:H+ antiporter subunit D